MNKIDEEGVKEDHHVTSILEDHERICWGCGLRLLLATYSPVFKCGWCGAITTQIRARKPDSFIVITRYLQPLRTAVPSNRKISAFNCCLVMVGAGVWAVYPTIFSISYFCGFFHSTITAILSFITISSFCMAAFKSAGAPIITGIASSVLMLSVRGLVLLYLAFACLSADIGIAVLLWQQLYYIYEGKTYITHISSQNTGNGGCQNILRFFSCPHWAFKFFRIPANTAKFQESSSKLFSIIIFALKSCFNKHNILWKKLLCGSTMNLLNDKKKIYVIINKQYQFNLF
ncbi:hypothetical protein M5K25_017144 [Dendrobium thyrsiflorum]|uniref:Protein S-acyltransferase n=1 Tax=Dendrobium thyrsiflorum TaxID=117978 RepID=A0ABD0ULH3_DENTH